ncbi:hypothetical protein NDU88_003118 [Pleurodeles waltl]|uniref:Uncharacterized protein n=1 Tax=Pleurodeles waltl TaxID=8319 RepID=A0AAV7SFV4_PLEWA|nr:hypothetical protein NDU88_003118 [Pleurodeles waltl]
MIPCPHYYKRLGSQCYTNGPELSPVYDTKPSMQKQWRQSTACATGGRYSRGRRSSCKINFDYVEKHACPQATEEIAPLVPASSENEVLRTHCSRSASRTALKKRKRVPNKVGATCAAACMSAVTQLFCPYACLDTNRGQPAPELWKHHWLPQATLSREQRGPRQRPSPAREHCTERLYPELVSHSGASAAEPPWIFLSTPARSRG